MKRKWKLREKVVVIIQNKCSNERNEKQLEAKRKGCFYSDNNNQNQNKK